MNKKPKLEDVLSAVLSFTFRAYREGNNNEIQSYLVYEGRNEYSEVYKKLPEHIDGIIAAFGKLNQRWPGFLTSVHPPKPEPANRNTVLWIMDPTVIWKQGDWFITPTMEEVYRVAGATW
jgi:hypothetical protein